MPALQLVEDEGLHLLLGDLARLDIRPDLLRCELGIAGAKGDVHHPDRVGRMSEQLDVDSGFQCPGAILKPQDIVVKAPVSHNLWKFWGQLQTGVLDAAGYDGSDAGHRSGLQPSGPGRQLSGAALRASGRPRSPGPAADGGRQSRKAWRRRTYFLRAAATPVDAGLENETPAVRSQFDGVRAGRRLGDSWPDGARPSLSQSEEHARAGRSRDPAADPRPGQRRRRTAVTVVSASRPRPVSDRHRRP